MRIRSVPALYAKPPRQRRWTKVRHWATEKVGGSAGAFAPYHKSGDLLCMTNQAHPRQRMCLAALRKNGRGGPGGLPRPFSRFRSRRRDGGAMGKERTYMKKRWTAWALTLAMLAGALPGTALAAENGGVPPEPAARQVAAQL